MTTCPPQLLLGLLLSSLIALIAYWRRALSVSGVAGAIITGSVIFGFGGWPCGMLLVTFFVTSTLLSKYRARTKAQMAEKFAKGSQRDLGQVLANSGAGALIAVIYSTYPDPALLFAFGGAMAAVNADTWATELGVLARRPPRLITTGRTVEPGTSGAISALGTLATIAGSGTIGVAAALFAHMDPHLGPGGAPGVSALTRHWQLIVACVLGGLAGSLFDSLLGATLQAIYYSPVRGKETERSIDPDGSKNEHVRGWRWLNNDWVNFLSSAVGALVSGTIHMLII